MKNLIDLIVQSQQKDGSFNDNQNKPDLLISSLILIELKVLETNEQNEQIEIIKSKLSVWILKQKNSNELFQENLMTTFLANAAITDLLDGKALSAVLSLLITSEIQEGGPYYSNINKNNKDIDLGVNVAIAYFLSLNKVSIPKLNKLIESAIYNKTFHSKFLSDNLIAFLLSKFYTGPQKKLLTDYLLDELGILNGPEKIISLSALNNLGIKIDLSNMQLDSPLLAAISLNSMDKIKKSETQNNQEDIMLKNILIKAKSRFNNLPPEFKTIAFAEINKTLKTNKDRQMSLIAYYFKIAMGSCGQTISDDLIAKAGLANIFFWTAFIIYDDFWDEDEEAIPSILPCANLYARHYTNFYNNILPEMAEFQNFFHDLMDKLDAANTWETLFCRTKITNSTFIIPKQLPNYNSYEYKFQAASGQILGPIILLIKAGFKLDSPEINHLINYFKNYLIAMQINDDSHDWLEDIKRGHLSTVVLMLIKDWQKEYPNKPEIDLVSDLKKLQQLFWFKTIKTAAEIAIFYTKKARESLACLNFLENPAPLLHFIDITENVAKEALNEQQKSLDFLKEFK